MSKSLHSYDRSTESGMLLVHYHPPRTVGAMSEYYDVCTPTAETKSDEYGVRQIASFTAIDEEEEGISGVWSDGN